ncbi:MAG: hypothetical protein ABJA49_04975 [Betaproteobacteria bacterium]
MEFADDLHDISVQGPRALAGDPGIPVGTVLTLQAQDIQTTATVIAMPVHDPAKNRTHAP